MGIMLQFLFIFYFYYQPHSNSFFPIYFQGTYMVCFFLVQPAAEKILAHSLLAVGGQK